MASERASADAKAEPSKTPWWKKRRNLKILAVALVAVVAVSNLGYQLTRPGPEAVVSDYLSAIQDGDVDVALDYVDGIWEFDEVSDDLLVSGAMTTDWKVTNVARRPGVDPLVANIDFTITAADKTTRTGRFELLDNGSDWQILNPLAKIDVVAMPVGFAEFNRVVGYPSTTTKTDDSRTLVQKPARQLWMFPGAYDPYVDSDELVKPRMSSYIAIPSKYLRGEAVMLSSQTFAPELVPGKKFVKEVNRQFTDWLDKCAASSRIAPKNCPFAAGAGARRGAVSLEPDQEYLTEKADWKVTAHPEIELIQANGKFIVREVKPGTVAISGEGEPADQRDGFPVPFSGECTIDMASLSVTLAKPGDFAFKAQRPASNCAPTDV
ncbi:hypothetical protein [Stackebrandtia nassauensis]|nr:hypothetical protein [Stackebrandtia nassauensis]